MLSRSACSSASLSISTGSGRPVVIFRSALVSALARQTSIPSVLQDIAGGNGNLGFEGPRYGRRPRVRDPHIEPIGRAACRQESTACKRVDERFPEVIARNRANAPDLPGGIAIKRDLADLDAVLQSAVLRLRRLPRVDGNYHLRHPGMHLAGFRLTGGEHNS
jgi:hypothetical protein